MNSEEYKNKVRDNFTGREYCNRKQKNGRQKNCTLFALELLQLLSLLSRLSTHDAALQAESNRHEVEIRSERIKNKNKNKKKKK